MTEEEIKKELNKLAQSDLNKDFLKDLAKFDEYYSDYLDRDNREYKVEDYDFEADEYDEIDRAKENSITRAKKIQKNQGSTIGSQIKSFFDGPKDASDEEVQKWVKDNYCMVRLLACSHMPEASKKLETSSFLFVLCSFAEKMPAAVSMAKNFMLKYHKEAVPDNDKHTRLSDDEYQNFMQQNLKDLKNQKTNLNEKDKNILNNTKTFLVESGSFYQDNKERFSKFAENLEKAKTYRNSKEYERLIKWVNNINSSEKYISNKDPYQGPRTDLHNYSMKLFALKSVINSYLNHKAKDGVKKNTYEKLAAVEELNSFVSGELEKYKPDYNARETAHRPGEKIGNCTYTAWREEFKKVPETAEMPDKQRAALNCMGRIIARAEKQQLPTEKIRDLKAMHTAFGGSNVKTAPEENIKPLTW